MARYQQATFECNDHSKTISGDFVNDDYCDCPDGSDEPATSACSYKFYCTNAGHIAEELPSSRVNDGICDCCDGTDEYLQYTKCENTCATLAKVKQAEAEKKEAIRQAGLKAKASVLAKAHAELAAKKAELENLNQLKPEREQALNAARDEKEAKEAVEQEEKDKLKAIADQKKKEREEREAQAKEDAAHEEQAKLEEEAQAGAEGQQEQQPEGTEGETPPAEDAPEVPEGEEPPQGNGDNIDGWEPEEVDRIPGFVRENQGDEWIEGDPDAYHDPDQAESDDQEPNYVDEEELAYQEELAEGEEEDDGWAPNYEPDEEDDGMIQPDDAEEDWDDDYDGEGEGEEKKEEDEDSVWQNYKNDEAEAARDVFHEKQTKFDEVNDQIRELEKLLEGEFGPDNEFFYLTTACIEMDTREYKYKLCPFRDVQQIPLNGGGETSMGRYSGWKKSDYGNYGSTELTTQEYKDGQGCWQGPDRSTTVYFKCGVEDRVLSVDEPSRCEYTMEVESPAACQNQ
eukprot:TRINITY_DN8659_c0_g1_i1.p1 TRINITY_DN8659_c0_g1~~TRINITY_DN8659_c0_g1_i1.p1  ORF type:complete len:550 (-),score=152.70 TRINITY_DN8659_c0_g1_i1:108-1646(-)